MSSSLNDLWVGMTRLFRGVDEGTRSIITQPYTEVNSKFGTQWEVSFYQASLAGGAILKSTLTTGSTPVAIKAISTQFDSEEISVQLFKSPAGVTGGTPLTTYKLRDGTGPAAEFAVTAGVTTTADGTAVGPKVHSLGSSGVGNSTVSSISQDSGIERILAPNTTYLYVLTNEDTAATRISSIASWYEGLLDYN